MKREFVLLGWIAALALPMTAQRAYTQADARGGMEQLAPVKSVDWNSTGLYQNRNGLHFWDFETPECVAQWSCYDADGDGNGWEVDEYYSVNGGSCCLTSRSYNGDDLNPDNWLISPQVKLDGTLTINAMNHSPYWPDVITVYVCTGDLVSVDDFVAISGSIVAPADWTAYSFDLSAYGGQMGHFAIRHHDSHGCLRVLVDDISIGCLPTVPENVYIQPGTDWAEISWEDSDDDMWSLRYRVYDPAAGGLYEDFEDCTESLPEGWMALDSDGDGYNWMVWDPVAAGDGPGDGELLWGNKCAASSSFEEVALIPDNWLITPEVRLSGELKLWAAAQDDYYRYEHFTVYVTTGDPTDLEGYVPLSDLLLANTVLTEYTFDLSDFAGMKGHVAIRHHLSYNQYLLGIDNVLVGIPGAEWICINGIVAPSCVLLGDLEENTEYEVQIRATDGTNVSKWTDSFIFKTGDKTAVGEIEAVEKGDDTYYNLTGRKMNADNLPAGIYIHNGKKVLVK